MTTDKERLAIVETEVRQISEDINVILTNHLPHITNALAEIKLNCAEKCANSQTHEAVQRSWTEVAKQVLIPVVSSAVLGVVGYLIGVRASSVCLMIVKVLLFG